MPINTQINLIHRIEKIVAEWIKKYAHQPLILDELKKLQSCLHQLVNFLEKIDELKPDYNTNQIKEYMEAINLHIDILQTQLEGPDSKKIKNAGRALRLSLKFHRTRPNFLTFIFDWFLEWMYFV